MTNNKELQNKLLSFSSSISFDWLNSNKDKVNKTSEYDTLIQLFPPLEDLFNKWHNEDSSEFFRTIVHTFQTQAAYNRILSGNFPESGLDREDIQDVCRLAESTSSFSEPLMPIILWFHDIGRFIDRRTHNERSAEMIIDLDLLKDLDLSDKEAVLVRKVVQYHLLIGTLYTGESSYMSFEPLLNDNEFQTLLKDQFYTKIFIEALTLFTMIDVWGYHINGVSSITIGNYLDIMGEMEEIFAESSDISKIKRRLKEKSKKHMDSRLMGFMMAFTKIGTKPHLTLEFFKSMLNETFQKYITEKKLSIDWNTFKDRYLNKIDKVHFKYGLGVLIPLSYDGTDSQKHFMEDKRVNPNLLHLLATINNKILKEEKTNSNCNPDALWSVLFRGYPPWNIKTDFLVKLNQPGGIEEVVSNSIASFDKDEGLNTLSVDYTGFWKEIE